MSSSSCNKNVGNAVLCQPLVNKGDAFSAEERRALGLEGLLHPAVRSLDEQTRVVLLNLARKSSGLEKYVFLRQLQSSNSVLFYHTLIQHIDLIMPLVYTPVVGEACVRYSELYLPPAGLFLPHTASARFPELLRNWPEHDVRVIVVTDGERILGLGDLAANGMGIPVGKLALYSACAGIHPRHTLPITLDMGTNTQAILQDPNYIGLRAPRIHGADFDRVLADFVAAVTARFPRALIQWEDFGNTNAFRLLDAYRHSVCSFNDDIQGTACVALSGLLTACRLAGQPLAAQRFLFLGAGEAGVGIGDLLAYHLHKAEGVATLEEARRRIFFVDSQGLVCKARLDGLQAHKRHYAHDVPFIASFADAVQQLRPSAIIGVSTIPGSFSRPVVEAMAAINARPIIFALSNPTSKSECTAEQAYTWSDGRAIFASGSPFDEVLYKGQRFHPGQGNNAYVFPGIGLGIIAAEAATVSEDMFLAAARALSDMVSPQHLAENRVYPPLSEIRHVSFNIAVAVAELAFATNVARAPKPESIPALIKSHVYEPAYDEHLAASL